MKRASLLVFLLALPLAGCHQREASAADTKPLRLPPPSQAELAEAPAPVVATAVAPAEAPGAAPTRWFQASGPAGPVRPTHLSSKAGGILKHLRAREGDRVEADQVLAELDTTDIALRVEGAQVAVEQASEGLRSAESDLKRAQSLFDGGALTDQAIEKAQLGVKMARLQLRGAQVALKGARQALDDTRLKAPFAGVVTRLMAEEGQMITMMPPVMIFELVDTSTLEVRIPIPERRLAAVKVGQPVQVALPALGVTREGKIDRLAEVVNPMTRSAEAIVRLDNADRALPAGLFASVTFPGVE